MSRQYFADVLVDPPIASGGALVSTAEEGLWAATDFTRIAANDCKPGKIYEVRAGGLITWASTGTLTLTPRMGLLISSPTLGVSTVALTTPGVVTNAPWELSFTCVIRTIGAAGANSTAIGTGTFRSLGIGTLGTTVMTAFGGTSATFDASVATGIWISKTLTVAGSITTQYVFIRSLN